MGPGPSGSGSRRHRLDDDRRLLALVASCSALALDVSRSDTRAGLLAMLRHDISNPVSVALGYGEILLGKLYAVEGEVSELGGEQRRRRLGELRRERDPERIASGRGMNRAHLQNRNSRRAPPGVRDALEKDPHTGDRRLAACARD